MQSLEFKLDSDALIDVQVEEVNTQAKFAIGVTADLKCIESDVGLRSAVMIECSANCRQGRFKVTLGGAESRFWMYLVRLEGGQNWWLPGMEVKVLDGDDPLDGIRFKCNVWCNDFSENVTFRMVIKKTN